MGREIEWSDLERNVRVVARRCEDLGYVKCPRCWRWHPVRANHDHLCDRCMLVLIEGYPDHPDIPAIKASLAAQEAYYRRT